MVQMEIERLRKRRLGGPESLGAREGMTMLQSSACAAYVRLQMHVWV